MFGVGSMVFMVSVNRWVGVCFFGLGGSDRVKVWFRVWVVLNSCLVVDLVNVMFFGEFMVVVRLLVMGLRFSSVCRLVLVIVMIRCCWCSEFVGLVVCVGR